MIVIVRVSNDALKFITSESAQRYILEFDLKFISEQAANLPELTVEQLQLIQDIEKDNQPSSTTNQTRQHILKLSVCTFKEHLPTAPLIFEVFDTFLCYQN